MRSNNDKAAQTAIDDDMLLQHISALNAKLTVAFEKKIEPLAAQIIAYKEVVAPLSQDLKRNLAALTPLLQQVQSMESALANTAQSFGQGKQAIADSLAEIRTDMAQAINDLQKSKQSDGASQEQFFNQFRENIEANIAARLETLEKTHDERLTELNDKLGALGPELSQLRGNMQDLESNLGPALSAQLEPLLPKIKEFHEEIKTVVAQNSATIETELADFKDRLDEFGPELTLLNSKISDLNSNIGPAASGQLEPLLPELKEFREEVRMAVAQSSVKIDTVLEALATPRVDTELSAHIDTVVNALQSHESGIKDAVSHSVTELQTDMSTAYNTWSKALESLTSKIDALATIDTTSETSRLDAIDDHIEKLCEKLDAAEDPKSVVIIQDLSRELTQIRDRFDTYIDDSSKNSAIESIAGFDRIIDTIHQRENDIKEALESAKYAIQTDMSSNYAGWSQGLNALSEKIAAVASQVHELAEAAEKPSDTEIEATVYHPVDNNLPEVIQERVDQVQVSLTNFDWSINAIGKNLATLMHEMSAMRDDVLSASMARRTYNAVEDVRALLENASRQNVPLDQADELLGLMKNIMEDARGSIHGRPDDLAKTFEQAKEEILASLKGTSAELAGPIDQSRQEILQQIGSSISAHASQILSHIDMRHNAQMKDSNVTLNAIETAALQQQAWNKPFDGERPSVRKTYNPDGIMDRLRKHDPITYKVWKPLFEAGEQPYHDDPDHNCSTWATPLTPRFRDYVSLFAQGSILDVGCGPHPMPAYLEGYPAERLTGLEPLDISGEATFPIIKGVNEFLPWADNSFETIVNATAIDHVMDLEKSLSETCRVLKDDGHFIIWFADVEDMEDYSKIAPKDRGGVDDYHLFHICSDWFLPLAKQWFDLVDLRRIPATSTVDNVFATFRPKRSAKTQSIRQTRKPSKGRKTKK